MLIAGAPGIGKTHVLTEILARADADNLRVRATQARSHVLEPVAYRFGLPLSVASPPAASHSVVMPRPGVRRRHVRGCSLPCASGPYER